MTPRLLAIGLLILMPLHFAGDDSGERDPLLAALAGKKGNEVAAPELMAEFEAVSWSFVPRREIVDGLAARLLRGEGIRGAGAAKEVQKRPEPPSRIPADFDPAGVPVTDRLASRVPGNTAIVFFESFAAAEAHVGQLHAFLPLAFPAMCADPPDGRRDALDRATEMLLLPPVWRANPDVRRGVRQVALVASDPDLRWAPDIALVCEVDDATLVRTHRQATFSWGDRSPRRLVVEGLDAWTEDGAIRSFFGMEGGVAVWSTTRSLRDRVLAAACGKSPTLLEPDRRAYALARATFPAAEGGALLVVPDAFLASVQTAEVRAKRSGALHCDAARLVVDAKVLAGDKRILLACPGGEAIAEGAGAAGTRCPVHGSASFPVPLGDVPPPPRQRPDGTVLPTVPEGRGFPGVPVAARWSTPSLDLLVAPGGQGPWALSSLRQARVAKSDARLRAGMTLRRLDPLHDITKSMERALSAFEGITGIRPVNEFGDPPYWDERGFACWRPEPGARFTAPAVLPEPRDAGGVLRLICTAPSGHAWKSEPESWNLFGEWR